MKPSLALMPPGACAGGLAARGRCDHCCHMRDEPGTAPIQLLVWLLVSFKTVVLDPLAAPHLTNLVLRHQLCHETYKEHGGTGQLCMPQRRSGPWRGGSRQDLVRSVLRRGAQPERQLVGLADRSRRRQLASDQVAVDARCTRSWRTRCDPIRRG